VQAERAVLAVVMHALGEGGRRRVSQAQSWGCAGLGACTAAWWPASSSALPLLQVHWG
jgi:hypothetical protein